MPSHFRCRSHEQHPCDPQSGCSLQPDGPVSALPCALCFEEHPCTDAMSLLGLHTRLFKPPHLQAPGGHWLYLRRFPPAGTEASAVDCGGLVCLLCFAAPPLPARLLVRVDWMQLRLRWGMLLPYCIKLPSCLCFPAAWVAFVASAYLTFLSVPSLCVRLAHTAHVN